MQFFKYSLVTMLLLLTPVESIMAACSDWLAPHFMKTDEQFVIHYYVTLKTRPYEGYDNYEYYPGYVKRYDKLGNFYFYVPQGKPIRLAFTGSDRFCVKMFVMPARGNMKAFFWPNGWFKNEFSVSGGYFSPEIWNKNPRTGEKLTCVKKTGSTVLLSPEQAKNFRPKRETRKLTDLRPALADTLSPKNK